MKTKILKVFPSHVSYKFKTIGKGRCMVKDTIFTTNLLILSTLVNQYLKKVLQIPLQDKSRYRLFIPTEASGTLYSPKPISSGSPSMDLDLYSPFKQLL